MSEGAAKEYDAPSAPAAAAAPAARLGEALPDPEDVPPVSAELLVDGELADGPAPRRRYPSTIGGACYIVVLIVAAAGVVVAARGDWRLGVSVLGGSLLGTAAARLIVPNREAGMLAVRSKWIDVPLLTFAGAALIFLAQTIPDAPR